MGRELKLMARDGSFAVDMFVIWFSLEENISPEAWTI